MTCHKERRTKLLSDFREKPDGDGAWINGGFFVLEPSVIDEISGDNVVWEREPLENLAQQRQLNSFPHTGFWRCMDTVRDKIIPSNPCENVRAITIQETERSLYFNAKMKMRLMS